MPVKLQGSEGSPQETRKKGAACAYAGAAFPDDPLRTYDTNKDGVLGEGELVRMLQDVDPAWQQDTRRQRRQSGARP